MKLSKVFWLVLGIGFLIVAAVVIYVLYQGQVNKQHEAEDTVAEAKGVVMLLLLEKGSLDGEVDGLEADISTMEVDLAAAEAYVSALEAELIQLEDERAEAILNATILLDETEAKFISSLDSIEYNEILLGFAYDSNLEIVSLTTSETSPVVEEDITYYNTNFKIAVRGEVTDILDFINTMVKDDDFKTAILMPISIVVPEPMTDEEKKQLREEFTEAEIERLIEEAMDILPVQERLTPEDIGEIIIQIGALLEELEELTAEEIAELTVQEIEDLIRQAIEGLEEKITEEDIIGLIGKLGEIIEELEGTIEGNIEEKVAEEILKRETPSATITLNIYTYEGEGE